MNRVSTGVCTIQDMQQYFQSMGPIDVGALIVVAFHLLMGLVRGFVWQLVRLTTIVAALLLARAFADDVAVSLARHFSVESPADKLLAYFVILFGVFVAGTLLALMLRKALAALKLQSYDRLFGGLLGAVKGIAIVVVIVLLLTQLKGATALQDSLAQSEAARLTALVVEQVDPLFPESVKQDFRGWIDEIKARIPDVPLPAPPEGAADGK